MKRIVKTRKILFILLACCLFEVTACGNGQQDKEEIVFWDSGTQIEKEEQNAETERMIAIYQETFKETARAETGGHIQMMQTEIMQTEIMQTEMMQTEVAQIRMAQAIVGRFGENGYAAVDSANQVDMTNTDQVLEFCSAVEAKRTAKLAIVQVIDEWSVNQKDNGFRKYDLQTENGNVMIERRYYRFDGYGDLVSEDTTSFSAKVWEYTEEGYLMFAGSYFEDAYYIMSLTDAPEYAALRVEPLDAECRELNRKYIQPVSYEDNNLFLADWTEEDFCDLDFYDLFDRFYLMFYRQSLPYTASKNPGIGAVYRILEKEFECVLGAYLDLDRDVLRSKTVYFPEEKTYEYKPRGFYEIGCTNMPYPEVVGYTENGDNTLTLKVNAVFPYEGTSKAFSHEVVIRLLEDSSFQYVSNRIVEGDYDAWWHTARLTSDEWEEVYMGYDAADESAEQNAHETEDSLWYLPQADDCLLTESEQDGLKKKALAAAGQVREVYQDMEIEDGASYASNVRNFTSAQRREVAALLGKAGFVSVTEDANMENYQDLESFYAEYENGHDAMVTVFEVNRDGLIGAVTLIYKKMDGEDAIQIYYVGIGWQDKGVPIIKNTLVSNVAEIDLTEKGYFIYTYEEQIVHSDARQYWRVRPLSEKCRELTAKYVAGISFVNYNAFATDWDSRSVEDILMPCMFEDIYRLDTGENLRAENDQIPAEVYERIMMTYFPVTREQLRAKCGYDAGSGSYPYEMIFAVPYAPFGEVVDYSVNTDGTITLFVDGVWIDYDSDRAFTSEIVVQPFADGSFRYLSNKIQPKELDLPLAASYQ